MMALPRLALIAIYSVIGLSYEWTVASARQDASIFASVGTFNAFLFRGAPGFSERKQQIINTLQTRVQNEAPDVLCIQELLRTSDVLDVANAVKSQYPYQASFINLSDPPTSGQRACSLRELTAAGTCLQQSTCGQFTGTAFFNCLAVECQDVLFQTSVACRLCSGSEGGNPISAFIRCTFSVPASEYVNPYGLLLLSRYRLTQVETVDYHPVEQVLLPRGYISAKVAHFKNILPSCHIPNGPISTGVKSTLFEPVSFVHSSSCPNQRSGLCIAEQQADEVKTILEFVERENQVILLGDFNHGPATPGLPWELPLNYGLMTARGLFSVNALWCGLCTFCAEENELAAPTGFTGVIDHIYLPTSKISAVFSARRLFDDIRTPSGLPLSDHHGVRATLFIQEASRVRCPTSKVLGRNVDFLDLDDIDEQIKLFCPAN